MQWRATEPTEFLVERSEGVIAWYGSSNSGGIPPESKWAPTSRIYSWPVRLEEDSFGNQIHYQYVQPGKDSEDGSWLEVLIDRVAFNPSISTGEPASSIKFHYEPICVPDEDPGSPPCGRSEKRGYVAEVRAACNPKPGRNSIF